MQIGNADGEAAAAAAAYRYRYISRFRYIVAQLNWKGFTKHSNCGGARQKPGKERESETWPEYLHLISKKPDGQSLVDGLEICLWTTINIFQLHNTLINYAMHM